MSEPITIEITADQRDFLLAECERLGISLSDLVRLRLGARSAVARIEEPRD